MGREKESLDCFAHMKVIDYFGTQELLKTEAARNSETAQ
jgi:hypothetical protein